MDLKIGLADRGPSAQLRMQWGRGGAGHRDPIGPPWVNKALAFHGSKHFPLKYNV